MTAQRHFLLLVLLLTLFLPASAVFEPEKRDSVHYNATALAGLNDTALYVRDSVPGSPSCSKTIIGARLKAYLYMGETYKVGVSAFTANAKIKVTGYSTFYGSTGIVDTWWIDLNISENDPEELFVQDFTSWHGTIDRLVVDVYSYTAPSDNINNKQDSVQLAVFTEEEFGVSVSGVDIDNVAPNASGDIDNPITFVWDRGGCTDIPNYQFQLLRIYNNNCPSCTTSVTNIGAVVDWDQALTIETLSADTFLTLTLTEGAGYYIWRVRPIGTYYSGGIADSRNWGDWSDNTYTDGGSYTFTSTSVTTSKFYYYQFDDDKNWIYARTFSEGDVASPKVRISEKMVYANGLQQVKQNQTHLSSTGDVLIAQTLYDWSGRPALSTLMAPDTSSNDTLGYRSHFVNFDASTLYTQLHFDEDSTYKSPKTVGYGFLTDYYSNSNTADQFVPNAEGYPYSRALYERDGTGRVKEQGGPGGTHRIKTINARTTRTFYSGVSDQELIRVFGDEAPDADGVHKVMNVDANSIASISYMSKEGQVIATCLSTVDSTFLDTLPGQYLSQFSVSDTVKGNIPYGQNGIVSSKPFAFATPTTVTVFYAITAKDIEHLCMNYCQNCDYTIDLLIIGDDTTFTARKLIPANACTNPQPSWDTTFAVTLDAGSYIMEKRVYANDTIPGSKTDSTAAKTYLEMHLDSLRARLQDTADSHLSTIMSYLASSNLDGLYTYLNISTNVTNPDSVFADSLVGINVGCDSIYIPILVCEGYDCHDSTPDFEGYFNDRWAGTHYVDTNQYGYLKYFPLDTSLQRPKIGFKPGQFNTMIANMLGETEYNCQDLWECWDRMVQSYSAMDTLSDTSSTYDLDLLAEFLNCTGTIYKGYSTNASYYRDSAYAYFYYYHGKSPLCDSMLKVQYGNPNTWTQDTLNDDPEDLRWKNYSSCINHIQSYSTHITASGSHAAAECGCNGICETRYSSFKLALIQMYHNDSIYVEGDVFELQRDSIWGQVFASTGDSLSGTPDSDHYRTIAEIECAARTLVEHCKENCSLTEYYTGNHLDSIGSSTEIENMIKAMTWTFQLALPNPTCSGDYTQIVPPTGDTLIKLWEQHFGAEEDDHLWDIVRDEDGCGGYLIAGWTNSTDTLHDISDTTQGGKDYWAVRINCNGDKMWDIRLGGSDDDTLKAVIQTRDGGYLFGGTSVSDSSGHKSDSSRYNTADYWVIKVDPFGNIEWDKTFGGNNTDVLMSLAETRDGQFLLGGYSNSTMNTGEKTDTVYWDPISYDYWLVKTDNKGNKIWDYTYGGTSNDLATIVRTTLDGNIILAGYSSSAAGSGTSGNKDSANIGNADFWLLKLDTAGNKLWEEVYGGTGYDYLLSVEPIKFEGDSGFIIAGLSNSLTNTDGHKTVSCYLGSGVPTYDYWALRLDKDGVPSWDNVFGGTNTEGPTTDRYLDIKETKGMSFYVGGSSLSSKATGNKVDSLYNSTYDYWVVKMDSSGTKKWDRSFGGNYQDYFTALDVDNVYDIWMAGYSYSDSSGNKQTQNHGTAGSTADYWVLKGREKCTHDTLCFKWVEPITHPDSIYTEYALLTCDSISSLYIYNNIIQQVESYIQQQLDTFRADYFATCANPDSITDTLVLSYNLKYHHYTLYYYDRAGNLVRTVAPKGVNYYSGTRSNGTTSHDYITKYKYNSVKQLIEQETPDGGITQFWYDYKGQLRFSQNAKQLANDLYSYTKYDRLGRILEVGESSKDASSGNFRDSVNKVSYPGSGNDQRTYTVYTEPDTNIWFIGMTQQRYLLNRVSYTYTEDSVYTWYSYDPHGNVEWLIQETPGLGKNYISYEYDLVSNKVLKVNYNESSADGFHHRYSYDEDQRIKRVETSRTNQIWDKDAQYTYYKHGPLKRAAIGEDKIQGLDYVYTINGWLKGINHPTLTTADDPGADGTNGYARDIWGMVLGYHANDFNRSGDGSVYNPSTSTLVSSVSGISNLYNGNISSWTLQTDTLNGNYSMHFGMKYRYDQLNRIKDEDYRAYTASAWSNPSQQYDNHYQYDANGNIDTLIRAGTGTYMDSLTYTYTSSTNKLSHVDDAVASAAYANIDIDDQSANNYLYDEVGQLVKDVAEDIDTILWTVYGKVRSVIKGNGDTISFVYDAMGNRVMKTFKSGSSGDTVVTYYVRDAQGNPLSIYERTSNAGYHEYRQTELPIYGSDRVGEYKPDLLVKSVPASGCTACGGMCGCATCTLYQWTVNLSNVNGYFEREIGLRHYEMKDHLGNVRMTTLDIKKSDGTDSSYSFSHYYAFGSLMPGRTYSSNSYRYGYNGQEKVDEIVGNANHYTAEFWEYDPRLGRRWERDPIVKEHESPYACFANNPIWFADPMGADTGDVVVAFGGGDIMGNKDQGNVAPDIIKQVKEQHLNKEGGAGQSFSSQYWGTDPSDPKTLDKATQGAYDFIVNNYNKDAEGNEIKGGRIMIYGYSYGGVLATHLADRLKGAGYTVDVLYTIDAAAGPETDEVDRSIGSNVKSNLNYYQTTPSMIGSHGAPNTPDDPSKTKVYQTELKTQSHSTIDDYTKNIVIKSMVGILNLQQKRK